MLTSVFWRPLYAALVLLPLHRPFFPREGGATVQDMTRNRRPVDPDTLDAARIALIAIRASVTGESGALFEKFIFPPDNAQVSASQAVARLSRLTKPVMCTAVVRLDSIVVSCESLSGEHLRVQQAHVEMLDAGGGLGAIGFKVGSPDSLLLIKGGGASLLVTVSALQRWYRDYDLIPGLVVDGRPPSLQEKASGAFYVVTIGTYTQLPPDSLPKEIKRFISSQQQRKS